MNLTKSSFLIFAILIFVNCQEKGGEKKIKREESTFSITNKDLKKNLTAFIEKANKRGQNEDCFLIDFGAIKYADKEDTLVFIYNAKPYNCEDCKGILYFMEKKVFFNSPYKNLDGIIEIKKPFYDCEKYNNGEFDLPFQMSWKFSKGKLLRRDE